MKKILGILSLFIFISSAFAQKLELVQNSPKAVEAYNRGLELQNSGNAEAALVEYDKAIRIDPKMAEVYLSRGNIYAERGNGEAALADYTKVIELNPADGLAYYNI